MADSSDVLADIPFGVGGVVRFEQLHGWLCIACALITDDFAGSNVCVPDAGLMAEHLELHGAEADVLEAVRVESALLPDHLLPNEGTGTG